MLPNAPRVVESVQDRPQLRTTDLKYKEKLQKAVTFEVNLKGQMGLFSGREGDAGYLRQSWSILGQLGEVEVILLMG